MGPLARGTCPLVTVALTDSGPQALLRLRLPFGLNVGACPSGNALPMLQKIPGVPSHRSVPHATRRSCPLCFRPCTWAWGADVTLNPGFRGTWAQGGASGKHHFEATFFPCVLRLSHPLRPNPQGKGE